MLYITKRIDPPVDIVRKAFRVVPREKSHI